MDTQAECSCDLLMQIAQDPTVGLVLRSCGLQSTHFESGKDHLHRHVGGEPADWLHRISSRGARGRHVSKLDQLLAIVRSADCHGYRLLEICGADLSALRKKVIEALSQQNVDKQELPGRLSHIEMGMRSERPKVSLRASQRAESSTRAPSYVPPPLPTPRPTPGLGSPRSQDRPELHLSPPSPAPSNASAPRCTLHPLCAQDLTPLLDRNDPLETLADAVSRERPRPILLVGERGSGRTVLAKHLCTLLEAPVYWIQATQISDEDTLRAALEGIQAQNGVVILDDLDRLAADSPQILPAIAQAWSEGLIRMVTVCSHETRARFEQWLPGILQSVDTISVPPLNPRAVHEAVKAAAPQILAQHGVIWAPGAHASEATRLADRYLSGMALPGRALDLIDLAAARAKRQGQASLDTQQLRAVVAQRTGLPYQHVHGSKDRELLDLEQTLGQRVVGHKAAIARICGLVRRNRAGFRSPRPIASVLLLGPSGIGKTEIAKALAQALFSQEQALLRLDMSEFSEAHAVARVVGAPPGYVGHEQGGALAEPMIERPHRIVLLDEIEKAHRDVHQLLLQILDEGRLTDGRGRTLDFRHALVVMTSNLAAQEISRQGPATAKSNAEPEAKIVDAIKRTFPIELWNRIEAPLVLRPLARAELSTILQRLVRRSSQSLERERNCRYELQPSAESWILDLAGQDPTLGARPLRHLLSRHIETALADALLAGSLQEGSDISVEFKRKKLVLNARERRA